MGSGPFIAHSLIAMLTTKEVLEELRRIGVKDRFSLRAYLKDFEDYMMIHYGIRILDTKKKSANPRRQKKECGAVKTKDCAAVLR
jgi:hypothetical protein